jgi:hypothetical protein
MLLLFNTKDDLYRIYINYNKHFTALMSKCCYAIRAHHSPLDLTVDAFQFNVTIFGV